MAALLINAGILILAAEVHRDGHTEISEIGDAVRLLDPMFGTENDALVSALPAERIAQIGNLLRRVY